MPNPGGWTKKAATVKVADTVSAIALPAAMAAQATASAAAAASLTYQSTTLSLAQLQAAGAVADHLFTAPVALPANARVVAVEIMVVVAFLGPGLVHAYCYATSNNPNNPASLGAAGAGNADLAAGSAGALFAQDLSVANGTNFFPTQGGSSVQLRITLTGGTDFNALTAGSVTVRAYYAVIP